MLFRQRLAQGLQLLLLARTTHAGVSDRRLMMTAAGRGGTAAGDCRAKKRHMQNVYDHAASSAGQPAGAWQDQL